MSTGSISGFDINQMFSQIQQSIATKGTELQKEMEEISKGSTLSQEQMLQMQFEVNQYNTMLETASTISKSLTDEAKQLAQRAQ
ncbi:MAG: hypothetical protein J6K46_03505 [Sutterella sp.]|nr:hypothetical protein [Sutterella sp.]